MNRGSRLEEKQSAASKEILAILAKKQLTCGECQLILENAISEMQNAKFIYPN
jgi:hypothetical protein